MRFNTLDVHVQFICSARRSMKQNLLPNQDLNPWSFGKPEGKLFDVLKREEESF